LPSVAVPGADSTTDPARPIAKIGTRFSIVEVGIGRDRIRPLSISLSQRRPPAEIVRLVGGGPPTKEVFVSVERIPVLLADVRMAIPKLKKELAKKWNVEDVAIEARRPRRKNPYDPKQIIELACVGIVARYVVGPVLKTGVADPVGAKLKKYVTRWLKKFDKSK